MLLLFLIDKALTQRLKSLKQLYSSLQQALKTPWTLQKDLETALNKALSVKQAFRNKDLNKPLNSFKQL